MALFDFLKHKEKKEKVARATEISRTTEEVKPKETATDLTPVHHNSVLVAPHVTERARQASELGQYTFRIIDSATKRDIKRAVEVMYGVHVEDVRIVKMHEKPRRRGLTQGVKKGYKKTVVALRAGEAIDIF
jgi:large subunit ribosomal protein L23